jgi:hypothetical protein
MYAESAFKGRPGFTALAVVAQDVRVIRTAASAAIRIFCIFASMSSVSKNIPFDQRGRFFF